MEFTQKRIFRLDFFFFFFLEMYFFIKLDQEVTYLSFSTKNSKIWGLLGDKYVIFNQKLKKKKKKKKTLGLWVTEHDF